MVAAPPSASGRSSIVSKLVSAARPGERPNMFARNSSRISARRRGHSSRDVTRV
jgi:hypothetical protein